MAVRRALVQGSVAIVVRHVREHAVELVRDRLWRRLDKGLVQGRRSHSLVLDRDDCGDFALQPHQFGEAAIALEQLIVRADLDDAARFQHH